MNNINRGNRDMLSDIHSNLMCCKYSASKKIDANEDNAIELDGLIPFEIIAGDDTYGEWFPIMGRLDTPINQNAKYFSIPQLMVHSFTQENKGMSIKFKFGNEETKFIFVPHDYTLPSPLDVSTKKIQIKTPVFASIWIDGETTGFFKFFYEFQEYQS